MFYTNKTAISTNCENSDMLHLLPCAFCILEGRKASQRGKRIEPGECWRRFRCAFSGNGASMLDRRLRIYMEIEKTCNR